MTTQKEEILSIEDCVNFVRINYNTLYPKDQKKKYTFGNIPTGLHEEILSFSEEHSLRVSEAIATLWDFYMEYEKEFASKLEAQRAQPKPRRS